MVISPIKTSVSESEENFIETKYSISYVRVSTKQQTEESKSGLKRQDDAYKQWLVANQNYKNLDGYVCRDAGVSGRGTNRKKGALSVLLRDGKLGKFPPKTVVVVENMTRLCREGPAEAFTLILQMRSYGLGIAFTQLGGNIFWGDETDPLWFQIMGGIITASTDWKHKQGLVKGYQTETSNKMDKQDYSFFKARKKGKKTNYKFWLDFDENTNTFFLIKEKADLVKRIFTMAEIHGSKKIAYILRLEGVKNPVEWGRKKSKHLTRAVIDQDILRCRAVLGEREHRGVVYKGVYPAIITPEQFDLVQAAIQKRRLTPTIASPKKEVVNLFQGVSFCAHCGGRMVVVRKSRDISEVKWQQNSPKIQAKYQTIQCNDAKEKLNDCPATNSAPYITKHNDIDNELKILNKIGTFRWAEFFTDEKHDGQLKVFKETRMRLLNERNKIDEKLTKLKKSRQRAWEEDEVVPPELKDLIKGREEEYEKAETGYKRSILDIQNHERKKTGKQLEVDIHKRVKTFIEKDRFNTVKRAEFNMFLKESGIALEVAIYKKQKASTVQEENYKFDVGVGMYDFIDNSKYRGLDVTEEAAVAFGMDPKFWREERVRRNEMFKKISEEAGRDLRFPSEEMRKRREESIKRFRENMTVEIHQGPVLPPDWKGDPDDYIDYWLNIERDAGRVNNLNYPTRWLKRSPKNNTLTYLE